MDDLCAAYLGLRPARLTHYEHWSCPDAETWITGIDYYEHEDYLFTAAAAHI